CQLRSIDQGLGRSSCIGDRRLDIHPGTPMPRRSSPMRFVSQALIQDTISRLEALATILSVDADAASAVPQCLSPDERMRKEIGLSIRVLLPKLRTVRDHEQRNELLAVQQVAEPPPGRLCMNCED